MSETIHTRAIEHIDPVQQRTINIRLSADGVPASLDAATRSVEVVCATENPVRVYDWHDDVMVDEVLLMSGCMVPDSRQVPLLDSHDRYSLDSVIGSCRGLRTAGAELLGRAHFADDPGVESRWNKMRGGHVTDVSVGYTVDELVKLRDGETTVVEGRTYTGPLRLVTRWTVKELSVCPIGADPAAKARADQTTTAGRSAAGLPPTTAGITPEPQKKDSAMDKKMRAFLERRGLPTTATEDEAYAFLAELDARQEPNLDAERQAAATAERGRVSEITAMCRKHGCEELVDKLVADGTPIDAARAQVLDHLAKPPTAPEPTVGFRVASVGQGEREKFRNAAEQGLLLRAGMMVENPVAGAVDLRGFSLREMARHSLLLAGQPTGGDVMEMAGRAMTTGDFPNILANVANKSLFTGYETADETWQEWCDVGSATDFKTQTLASASESSDLDQITDEQPYKYGEVSDAKEQYAIATYGKLFALTRHTIINDDLGALTTVPKKHGEAAGRKIGDIAYAVLTANGNMRDGVALFHANHGNLGTAGVPSETTIAEAIKLAKLQKDLAAKRRLNIRLQYFIAPATLEGAAEIFFSSTQFASDLKSATRVNPYAGSRFTRIYDARLDDSSTQVWYMAGSKGKTVTVFFLNGQQTPYLETKQGWSVDGVEFKVRIDAGAKAVDWKAMIKNAGA